MASLETLTNHGVIDCLGGCKAEEQLILYLLTFISHSFKIIWVDKQERRTHITMTSTGFYKVEVNSCLLILDAI